MKQNTTVTEFEHFVEKFCKYLDPQIQPVCPLLIEQVGQEVIDVLIERENPTVVCQQIKLCNSTRI